MSIERMKTVSGNVTRPAILAAQLPGRALGGAGTILLCLAYLLPVGDAPWFSFWREWAASAAITAIVLGLIGILRDARRPLQVFPFSIPILAFGLAALCWVQFAASMLSNHADAILPSLYLLGFGLCVLVAASLSDVERSALADRVAAAMLVAALLSAPLAILQWVGMLRLDLEIPVAGGRPVAHMEQANLLCSLLIQGMCGAWRLTERRRLSKLLAALICVPILTTLVLTQSRVALLVGVVFVFLIIWRKDIVSFRTHGLIGLVFLVILVIGALGLPWVDSIFGINGASLSERSSPGRRPEVWSLFFQAILRHPWGGWGVLQNGFAQYALAAGQPSLGYYFSSAHDFAIDLMVWFGIPIGMLSSVAIVFATIRRVALARDGATLATLFGSVALLLHGFVELPLHYLYFLLPLGLYLGTTTPTNSARQSILEISAESRFLIPAIGLLSVTFLGLLPIEYRKIGDVRPILDFEQATQHWVLSAQPPFPDIILLDQLHDYHVFASIPLKSGLPESEIKAARLAMLRTPFAPSIERFALLAGINGRELESLEALQRVCKFEPPNACADSRRAWSIWRERWPQLPVWLSQEGPEPPARK